LRICIIFLTVKCVIFLPWPPPSKKNSACATDRKMIIVCRSCNERPGDDTNAPIASRATYAGRKHSTRKNCFTWQRVGKTIGARLKLGLGASYTRFELYACYYGSALAAKLVSPVDSFAEPPGWRRVELFVLVTLVLYDLKTRDKSSKPIENGASRTLQLDVGVILIICYNMIVKCFSNYNNIRNYENMRIA
jgi:hypothetical protein